MIDVVPKPFRNAVAMNKDAREYVESAQQLMLKPDGSVDHFRITSPIVFLVSHSIELTLKSYLRIRAFDDDRLKKVGHRLLDCLQVAESEGLLPMPDFVEIVGGYDESHAANVFRYQREVYLSIPKPWPASEIVLAQVDTVDRLIRAALACEM